MWTYNNTTNSDELYHYGIKGMHWGIRRFQKKDGSLTSSGKKRYLDDPTVQKSKQDLVSAKANLKSAKKDRISASNKLQDHYSAENKKAYKDALEKYGLAKDKMKYAKSKYNVDKSNAKYSTELAQLSKKSKHRLNLEQKYRKAGMTKEEAETAAAKRIKKEKVLAAAAGITVAAATAYVVNNKLKEKCDSIIKAGKTLQRIEMRDTGGKLYEQFYAASNRADKIKYAGRLGQLRMRETGEAYVMKIGVDKDIKVAGRDKAIKTFKKLYDTDPDFKKEVSSFAETYERLFNKANGDMKKMYDNFNSAFVEKRDSESVKKFRNALKAEGYGAIKDMNDGKLNGWKAKNPLILFDHKGKVTVKSFDKMYYSDVDKNLAILGRQEVIKSLSVPVSAIVGMKMAKDNTVKDQKKSQMKNQKLFVRIYKKEHPNTRLSDDEIAKLM